MYLRNLINRLREADPNKVVSVGIGNPHSYRGYYSELAFEPVANTTVGAMLASAENALGSTYEGWKGGDFTMGEYTDCYWAYEGCTGEEISSAMIDAMLGEPLRMPERS